MQLCKNNKYSQQELADKDGISRKLLIDIEAGMGTSQLIFIKLLKAFKKKEKTLKILHSSSISPKEQLKISTLKFRFGIKHLEFEIQSRLMIK